MAVFIIHQIKNLKKLIIQASSNIQMENNQLQIFMITSQVCIRDIQQTESLIIQLWQSHWKRINQPLNLLIQDYNIWNYNLNNMIAILWGNLSLIKTINLFSLLSLNMIIGLLFIKQKDRIIHLSCIQDLPQEDQNQITI